MPGQTIEDIARAEAAFLERVIALHPEADGKPAVIGNCQAGWAVMMLAAMRPELFGPIIVAGSPLSYWAGVHGENPMRYTGGLLGGSWLTALMGDLGNGKFDGAWLVSNFENLNPANTYWTKHYNLYSKIDTEAPRYLEFEQWWGGHVLLNAEEMQFIADELFIGNKLATAEIVSSDGSRVDLRNIRSPIVVFCSKADNITPPPQALDWILDLYESVDDIRAHGQTIVYAVHESIGHLGIFVSGSVAKKEHDEFASNIDLIDVLPPGLYEAVMTPKEAARSGRLPTSSAATISSASKRELSTTSARSAATTKRTSASLRPSPACPRSISASIARSFSLGCRPGPMKASPNGCGGCTRCACSTRCSRMPIRSCGRCCQWLEDVRENRQPVDGQCILASAGADRQLIETSLDAYRDMRDRSLRGGVPRDLRIAAGAGAGRPQGIRRALRAAGPGRTRCTAPLVAQRIDELRDNISARRAARGGDPRAPLHSHAGGSCRRARVQFARRMREEAGGDLPLAAFKTMVREQFFMLLLDERRAVEAIPAMLDADPELASRMGSTSRKLIEVLGVESKLGKTRLAEMTAMFESRKAAKAPKNGAPKEGRAQPARPAQPAAKPHRPHSRNLS